MLSIFLRLQFIDCSMKKEPNLRLLLLFPSLFYLFVLNTDVQWNMVNVIIRLVKTGKNMKQQNNNMNVLLMCIMQ